MSETLSLDAECVVEDCCTTAQIVWQTLPTDGGRYIECAGCNELLCYGCTRCLCEKKKTNR